MKRIAIGLPACAEMLAVLLAVAWADGKLLEEEKEGVRAAARVLRLPADVEGRIEALLEKPSTLAEAKVDALSARDGAFAFAAAAWLAAIDGHVDAKESAVLDELARALHMGDAQRWELEALAREVASARHADTARWADDFSALLRAIASRIWVGEDVEVAFE